MQLSWLPVQHTHTHTHTCRYMSAGRALMLLMPSEHKGMLAQLEEAKVCASMFVTCFCVCVCDKASVFVSQF